MRNLMTEMGMGEDEVMHVPLPKHKIIVDIHALLVHEDGEVEIKMEYDAKWAKEQGHTPEEIQEELEIVLVDAMEEYAKQEEDDA